MTDTKLELAPGYKGKSHQSVIKKVRISIKKIECGK